MSIGKFKALAISWPTGTPPLANDKTIVLVFPLKANKALARLLPASFLSKKVIPPLLNLKQHAVHKCPNFAIGANPELLNEQVQV